MLSSDGEADSDEVMQLSHDCGSPLPKSGDSGQPLTLFNRDNGRHAGTTNLRKERLGEATQGTPHIGSQH